mmetsp:Transcript_29907/g.47782  ORF Transcript_29907/g.47782 Transcript_29907/m.47782 type:complete len:226 (-) Transcript_29907:591-1268(-)
MTRSITLSNDNMRATSCLVSTSPTIPLVIRPFEAFSTASTIRECKYRHDRFASLPPFSSKPFPDLIARDAIWGRQSGLDSKMMSRTPIGTVFCCRMRPLDTSREPITFPIGSSDAAIWRIPWQRFESFFWSRTSLFLIEFDICMDFAASISSLLTFKISSLFAQSASATHSRIFFLSKLLSAWSLMDIARARMAAATTVSVGMGRVLVFSLKSSSVLQCSIAPFL